MNVESILEIKGTEVATIAPEASIKKERQTGYAQRTLAL